MVNNKKNESLVDAYVRQNNPSSAPSLKRVGALLIDSFIIAVLSWVFSLGTKKTGAIEGGKVLIDFLLNFCYAGYFYSVYSATPGKMVFNLEVIKDSDERMNFVGAGFRDTVGKTISGVILGIGFLMAFFRADRRALHDLMFKTKVVVKE